MTASIVRLFSHVANENNIRRRKVDEPAPLEKLTLEGCEASPEGVQTRMVVG